jgi:large subunit ribosomal protein L17
MTDQQPGSESGSNNPDEDESMRHQKSGRKLGRTSAHYKAMFKNMTTSLLIHDRIQTTNAKAKELRKHVDKMITLARKVYKIGDGGGDKGKIARALHYRRQALKLLVLPRIDAMVAEEREGRKELMDKLFVNLAGRYADRPGGYTRILKLGNRRGDGAPVSLIEFVGQEEEAPEQPTKKTAKKKSKAAAADKPEVTEEAVEAATEETTEEAAPETDEKTAEPEAATKAGDDGGESEEKE